MSNTNTEEEFQLNEDSTKLILAVGSHVSKIMLKSMVTYFNRQDLIEFIDTLCSVDEIGCYQIDYINKLTDQQETAYIVLGACDKDHNLTEQLDKLKIYVTDTQWAKVLKSLSSLILLTRSIYSSIYLDNKQLFDDVITNDQDYNKLLVDTANTTLYLPCVSERIGIFIEK
jgi:hypothetical protein